jgi:hypothetical protein
VLKQALLGVVAWVGLVPGATAEPAGRPQEGPFTKHFDASADGAERARGNDGAAFRDVRLTGRCVAVPDIFSGRPNPRWTLSSQESRRLWIRIGRATSIDSPARGVGRLGLGYRGITLRCDTRPEIGDIRILCGEIFTSAHGSYEPVAQAAGLDRDLLRLGAGRAGVALQRRYDRTCGS